MRGLVVGCVVFASVAGCGGTAEEALCGSERRPSIIVAVTDASTGLAVPGVTVTGIREAEEIDANCASGEPCEVFHIAKEQPGHFEVRIEVEGYDDETYTTYVQDGLCHVDTQEISVGLTPN